MHDEIDFDIDRIQRAVYADQQSVQSEQPSSSDCTWESWISFARSRWRHFCERVKAIYFDDVRRQRHIIEEDARRYGGTVIWSDVQ